MKSEFFSRFSFEELLLLRSCLCKYIPTENTKLDEYIATERDSGNIDTRTNRCVTLIDQLIVRMAIHGELMVVSEHPHEIDFNRP